MDRLETLKDVKLNFQDITELNEKYESWLKKKFLEKAPMNLIKFFQYELRKKDKELGIKWIKELRKTENYLDFDFTKTEVGGMFCTIDELDLDSCNAGFIMTKGIIHWIKHNFNISENDLLE